MEAHWRSIIEHIGEDPTRAGLVDTPKRAAKAFEFLTRGYAQNLSDVVNDALFPSDSSEMVLVQNIELYSLCEHHIAPFFGYGHIAYIPNKKIVGLSKLARTLDLFAHRLQNQERITTQVADFLQEKLDARGIAVSLSAKHMCMEMRGVKKHDTWTTTTKLIGMFKKNDEARLEFFNSIKK